MIPIIVSALGTVPNSLEKRLRKLEIRERMEIIPAIKISWNSLKSPGDLRRFAVIQTSMKNPPVKTGMKNLHKVCWLAKRKKKEFVIF